MEKKFHDMQTEHEQEKIELQKAQTASIQQLMDDTNERLLKMEEDYRKQSKTMGNYASCRRFIFVCKSLKLSQNI